MNNEIGAEEMKQQIKS